MGLVLAPILNNRLVDPEIVFAFDREGLVRAAEVDGEAAAARGLSADRAVAEVERVGVRRLQRESDGAAMARTFELH